MEQDLKLVLDAWRKLLVENDRLQQENQMLKTEQQRRFEAQGIVISHEQILDYLMRSDHENRRG